MSNYRPRIPGFVAREKGYTVVLPADVSPRLVVDVGGQYDSTSWLRDTFPGAKIIASNVSQSELDSIPDEWADKQLGRAESLDTEGHVDLIFLGEVLEHLLYPQEFLEQATKLLRHGGLVLISTPNLATWHNRLLLLAGYSPSNYSMVPGRHLGVPRAVSRIAGLGYGDHVRVFTYKALRQLFSEPPWRLEGIAGRSDVELNRPYYRARIAVSKVLPPSARETVFVCASLAGGKSPVTEFVEESGYRGYIGTTATLDESRE